MADRRALRVAVALPAILHNPKRASLNSKQPAKED